VLPGKTADQLPVLYRVTIGDPPKVKGKSGPSKRDYFVIKRLSPEGQGNWVTDEEAQARLVEWAQDEKPRVVQVVFMSDNIEDVFASGIAWYGRRKRYCWAKDFKGVDIEDEEAPAHCIIHRFQKPDNMSEQMWREIKAFHNGPNHVCRPSLCPNWNSDKPSYKCKPFGYLRFLLPFAPTFPGVAEFRSVAWSSNIAIQNTLRDFQRILGGRLAGVPLHLRMWWRRSETQDGVFVNPAVTLDYPGDTIAFREFAEKYIQRRVEQEERLRELAERYKPMAALAEETEDDIERYTEEFVPEAEDLPEVDLEAKFNSLADTLQWTQAKREAVRSNFDSLEGAVDYAETEFARHVGTVKPEKHEPEADDLALFGDDET